MSIFNNKAAGAGLYLARPCPNQIAKDKIKKALKMHQAAYQALGINNYYLRLSKFANGSDVYAQVPASWKWAEGLLRSALMDLGFPFYEEEEPDKLGYPRISFVHGEGFDLCYIRHRF